MRLDEKINIDGIRIMIITIGKPIIVGEVNEENKFSFISGLMVF